MALASTQPLVKMSTRNIHGGKGGRCVRLTTSQPSCAKCHENLGAQTSWNPLGHNRPVTGLLYLFFTFLFSDFLSFVLVFVRLDYFCTLPSHTSIHFWLNFLAKWDDNNKMFSQLSRMCCWRPCPVATVIDWNTVSDYTKLLCWKSFVINIPVVSYIYIFNFKF